MLFIDLKQCKVFGQGLEDNKRCVNCAVRKHVYRERYFDACDSQICLEYTLQDVLRT